MLYIVSLGIAWGRKVIWWMILSELFTVYNIFSEFDLNWIETVNLLSDWFRTRVTLFMDMGIISDTWKWTTFSFLIEPFERFWNTNVVLSLHLVCFSSLVTSSFHVLKFNMVATIYHDQSWQHLYVMQLDIFIDGLY